MKKIIIGLIFALTAQTSYSFANQETTWDAMRRLRSNKPVDWKHPFSGKSYPASKTKPFESLKSLIFPTKAQEDDQKSTTMTNEQIQDNVKAELTEYWEEAKTMVYNKLSQENAEEFLMQFKDHVAQIGNCLEAAHKGSLNIEDCRKTKKELFAAAEKYLNKKNK